MTTPKHYERVKEICRQIYKDCCYRSDFALDHPLYKELVGMGEHAVPALLHRLDCFEDDWDGLAIWEPICALAEITDADVIPEKDAGRLHKIIGHWLDWGAEQGIYERVKWDG